MAVFQTKQYKVTSEEHSIACLSMDFEKDSFSLMFDPEERRHLTWIEDETYLILITDCRPLELANRYEDHDLYTLAFNKKEYKVKNFDTNNWDKRNPTEVERRVLDLYQRKGKSDSSQISGVLATAEISPISIKKAMAKKSDDDVVFTNDFATACKGETPPQWLSEPEKVFTIVGSQGYRKGNANSVPSWTPELAEEKLKWLESLDFARLEALKEKTAIYPKDIVLAILRGE
ncbi:hypothetical protein [Roseofilum sp. Guam]|uniref:hypothetical protein n=1 Tax=Roseofilum sp. Guam TaxID=2821502 RepID=UPI001B13A79E|nr:hypothetical protein [Roseofilum sp. Guam]MBP0031189.1 hypothetical protein [Roseofilum sp. Guam]